jgi:hypothetical protein
MARIFLKFGFGVLLVWWLQVRLDGSDKVLQ